MITTKQIIAEVKSNTKILILCWILKTNEVTVSELVENMGANRTNISKQINEMKRANLLVVREEGRNNYYSLSKELHSEQLKMIKAIVNSYHHIDENDKTHEFYK